MMADKSSHFPDDQMIKQGTVPNMTQKVTLKGPDHLGPRWGILADFWVPHDIESIDFQNLLAFGIS